MPSKYRVADHGDTLQLKRVNAGEGVTAVLFRNIPPAAHEALAYLADLANGLDEQLKAETIAHVDFPMNLDEEK